MHRQSISQEIFESAWEYEAVVGNREDADDQTIGHLTTWHALQSKAVLSIEDPDHRVICWRSACAYLAKLALVKWDRDSKSITIHPLVQTWARHRLARPAETWQKTASILTLAIQENRGWTQLSVRLQRHLESGFEHCKVSTDAHTTRNLNFCQMLYFWAWQLYMVRSIQAAEVVDCLLSIMNQLFNRGQNSLQIADCQYLEGVCSHSDGKITKAIKILERVVKVRKGLAENHPDQLASQHELAAAYQANGQIDKAVAMLEHVVKVRKRLAENHPDQLASQHELARAYQANGQISKAVAMLEHVVKVRDGLAENHPERLASQHELAAAYQANGQIDKAVAMLERVVKVKEALAENHPSRLASQHELAGAYQGNGQIDKAVAMLEHVVKVKEALAENHPSQLASQHALAGVYQGNGQIDKAVAMLEHVVKVKEALAENHPERLASQHALAGAFPQLPF